jgi:hypoxanthine phosphoribosyltransferase
MKKVYYNWQQIQGAVLDIARQMQMHDWKPDYIVGITRGGAIPAVLLSQYTGIPMHPLEVSLRDGGDTVSNLGMAEDAIGAVPSEKSEKYGGNKWAEKLKKKILIVDDINDTGATINWIKKDWPSGCYPNDNEWNQVWGDNVRFAVLTHNFASEFKDPDYCVWTVNKAEEDCWLVYPWEDFWL